MAGMLPGVECARRRRFHQSGSPSDHSPAGSRRSSFCLYATGHEKSPISRASMIRNMLGKETQETTLGGVAREAKERLDARFNTIRRHNNLGSLNSNKHHQQRQQMMMIRLQGNYVQQQKDELCHDCYKGVKEFIWRSSSSSKAKKGWSKVSPEQAECPVCLEEFKAGDVLVHLPCAHRFHSDCVVPWLESSSHCPCCRTAVLSK